MRLVILTGEGLEHRYVASVLAEQFPDDLKAVIVARGPQSLLAETKKQLKRYSPGQFCSRVLAKSYLALIRQEARRESVFADLLFGGNRFAPMPQPELLKVVPSHNGEECRELLAEIRPDIIAVYGTVVIKRHIMELARVRALNMHTGIAPRYRGADTVFWPLYNEEPEWVGVTVHVLDEGVDSGPVISTGRPLIEHDDDEDRLFAKCTIIGADLYAGAIRRVADGAARPIPQELATGRQYRFVDRTIAAERRVKHLIEAGLLVRYARAHRAAHPLQTELPALALAGDYRS